MPIVTLTILIACVGFSLYALSNREIMDKYMFNPYAIKHFKQRYRFLSHAFIHADYGHLIVNMYVLYTFGSALELAYFHNHFEKLSALVYLIVYTGGIYASSFVDYFRHKNNPNYNAVGASGAVSALVFSYILFTPGGKMGMLFLPQNMGIPSWLFGALFLVYSFVMDKRKKDNVAHGAHAWGAIFGFLCTGILDWFFGNPLYPRAFHSFGEQVLNLF